MSAPLESPAPHELVNAQARQFAEHLAAVGAELIVCSRGRSESNCPGVDGVVVESVIGRFAHGTVFSRSVAGHWQSTADGSTGRCFSGFDIDVQTGARRFTGDQTGELWRAAIDAGSALLASAV